MADFESKHRLGGARRSALLAGLKGAIAREGSTGLLGHRSSKNQPAAESFAKLPGLESIRVQKSVAAKLGIDVPFYRLHEARAGRTTLVDGRHCTNFTSYDYLSLNGHDRITQAVVEAAQQWGTSVSASRLTSGERPAHRALEGELARLYGAEEALVFVSGHATNLATIATITGPRDLILHDALSHNSIVLGAQVSGAARMNFPHNDLEALEALLERHRRDYRHCLIVTEGHFSMDGDGPDLARLVEIKERHASWLMIDEAHSLGVLGRRGLGIFEHCDVDPARVDIWMGTLSKTLVSCGGYIAGRRDLIDALKFSAPGMVYSVGLPVPSAVAALTALDIMLAEPERVARLQANGRYLLRRAQELKLDTGTSWGFAVIPIILGDSLRTVLLSDALMRRDFATVPVFPPGVPERMARLRLFLASDHEPADIDALLEAIVAAQEDVSRSGLSIPAIVAKTIASRTIGEGE